MKLSIFWVFIFCGQILFAQAYTSEQRLQGYVVEADEVTFIFDPSLYAVDPDRVLVTGAFRNWDQNMESQFWQLEVSEGLWLLTLANPDFSKIPPGSSFKFRINEGIWMDPPGEAPNRKGSDLVFLQGVEIPELVAEVRSSQTMWVEVKGAGLQLPREKAEYILTDLNGRRIELESVLPNTTQKVLLISSDPLDKKRIYSLQVPTLDLRTQTTLEPWFQSLYSTKALGANIEGGQTHIRIFAPRATKVMVYLYRGRGDEYPYLIEEMDQDDQGVWETTFDENLHGIYYDFTVHGADDPGNHFFETEPVHITDPYARVSDNTWGRARIWEKTQPASPLPEGIPPMEDVIAYEVHIQDFTDLLPVSDDLKGTFPAMVTPGLRNRRRWLLGFDYLLDLGVNTVHLMPVQEYLHFPDEDWKASFQEDPYMIEQGVSEENYQWGYRTSHAFAIESKYRSKGSEPGTERAEFRDLVQAFHEQGMAVIIDIVPNHTAENMDGNQWFFNFNALDKLYYYRTKDLDHIGAYGNEVKTENRPMVQRWLIDQCKHLMEEFGIDGFRIDLAGQIDEQTLIALKDAIGHDKILYGEAWMGSNDPAYENNPDWDWYKEDAPITFFQDDSRNAFKGGVFELTDKEKHRGWPGGNVEERDRVMLGLTNTFPEEKSPLSGITYLDIHDNYALADQFATNDFDGRFGVDEELYKIAATLLFTSLGPIVMHGGTEIMRSKGAAPLQEVVKETQAGYKVFMHGKRDTYNHRAANQFQWDQLGARPTRTNPNDYQNMYLFWKGLIAFRKSEYGKVFRVAEAVPETYYHFITPKDPSLLGYVVDQQVFVLLNTGDVAAAFEDINLPAGSWKLIANTDAVDHENGVQDIRERESLQGGAPFDLVIPAESLFIWVREDEIR